MDTIAVLVVAVAVSDGRVAVAVLVVREPADVVDECVEVERESVALRRAA